MVKAHLKYHSVERISCVALVMAGRNKQIPRCASGWQRGRGSTLLDGFGGVWQSISTAETARIPLIPCCACRVERKI
jgi:hypothetical protein